MKLILIDPQWVKPRKPEDAALLCGSCNESDADWFTATTAGDVPTCAYCVLYGTSWGEQNALPLQRYISAVGDKLGRRLLGEDGRIDRDGANRILFGILAGSRLALTWKSMAKK